MEVMCDPTDVTFKGAFQDFDVDLQIQPSDGRLTGRWNIASPSQ